MVINQAMASQRGEREAGARYVREFIEEMKASGFVAKAIERHKQTARGGARRETPRVVDFSLSPEQERIREAIAKLCARFADDYWLEARPRGRLSRPTSTRRSRATAGSASPCRRRTAARASASPRPR